MSKKSLMVDDFKLVDPLPPALQKLSLNLVKAFGVGAVGIIIAKLVEKGFRAFLDTKEVREFISSTGYSDTFIDIISNGAKYLIYLMTSILVLNELGFSTLFIEFLLMIIVIISVLIILLSLRDFVPNAAAGLYLARTGAIEKGDKIEVDDIKGEVDRISLLNTTIMGKGGKKIIVPNSLLNKKIIVTKKKGKLELFGKKIF